MSQLSPGFHYKKLLRENPQAAERFLDADSAAVLRAVLAPDKVGKAIADIVQLGDIVNNDEQRNALIDLLPEAKQAELRERAGNISSLSARAALMGFFGVSESASTISEPTPAKKQCLPDYGLFDYQRRAVFKVLDILNGQAPRVLLHLPTGAGKTRTAMHIVCRHLMAKDGALVLWLASVAELLEQAANEFERAWGKIGDSPAMLARWFGENNPDWQNLSRGMIVAGLQKLHHFARRSGEFPSLAQRVTLVIFDEGHQGLAPTYRDILAACKIHNCGIVGLSATPGRTSDLSDHDDELAKIFDRQKVGIEVPGGDNPVKYLIEQGFLAKPEFRQISFDSAGKYEESSDDEYPDEILAAASREANRNQIIIAEVRCLAKRHRRLIIFAASVRHSQLLAAILSAEGYNAQSVSAETPPDKRNYIIKNFRSIGDGNQKILCNYGVLTTGFDAPATSAALIARPTKSLVLYNQMVGRAIRGRQGGGNDRAEIVTVVDTTLHGFGNIAEAFSNWEEKWQ